MELVVFRGTRHEVGRQIGERYRDNIAGWVERHAAWDRPGVSRERVVAECDRIFDLLSTISPELCTELDGIAEGADLPLEHVLCYNFHNALIYLPAVQCTNLIMRATDRGPLLIKNHDSVLADKPFYHLQHLIYDDGPRLLVVTYGGTVWGQGLSSAGIATGGSSVHPRERGAHKTGLPDTIVGRLLLERPATVAEAVELFEELPYQGKGCNYAICDASGDGAILEASRDHKVVRRMDGDYIYCTNYYASGEIQHATEPEYMANAVGRARLLKRRLAESDERTVARAIEIMSGHDGPVSLCRHAGIDSTSNDTLMTHAALPAEGAMLFADGFPCEAEWVEYEV
ncbi:MAG: hypothetical protein J7M38_11105 [Armatimonadetes bacterium]|nr:hypothetical protein [Armatimonadota bacterium]